ncbi:SDR family NAD(P)-dependent oxidoreductase [Aestuariibacter salexigens]|uniref:SDR family NAD(P)-dependent oxidoreductase n=1 Tax=Aestuariibacter salexigens TaxID=226010 RepID=UPI000401774A|nr:SDR family NAD(P)-dependent oxidoreductase [Aestuariibacter salexigens]
MQINQLNAVVTGGASGLGLATVNALLNAGMKVAVFDINQEQGSELVAEKGADSLMFEKVDVRSADSVEQAMQSVLNTWGAVHLCVNCAGVAPAKRTLDREGNAMPLDNFQSVIDINLVGSFNVARVAAAAMAKNAPMGEAQERGLIVNTASIAGYEGQIGQTAYAASKGGIIGVTLPMARDLAALGIRVNTIAPGIMGTPMLLAMPDNVQQALVSNVQFPKRLGLPEEFGKLVIHLADNAYINGETIRMDGALRMQPK